MRTGLLRAMVAPMFFSAALVCAAQSMPTTTGETLSGKHVEPAQIVQGHAVILVAGFSHEAGMHSGEWRKAIRADSALSGIPVYELAMLEKAPAMIRGIIKSGMRKNVSPAEQDQIVVLTQDEKLWERFFGVGDDKDPYVMMLDAKGNVLWHGHGSPSTLEPDLKDALKN